MNSHNIHRPKGPFVTLFLFALAWLVLRVLRSPKEDVQENTSETRSAGS